LVAGRGEVADDPERCDAALEVGDGTHEATVRSPSDSQDPTAGRPPWAEPGRGPELGSVLEVRWRCAGPARHVRAARGVGSWGCGQACGRALGGPAPPPPARPPQHTRPAPLRLRPVRQGPLDD